MASSATQARRSQPKDPEVRWCAPVCAGDRLGVRDHGLVRVAIRSIISEIAPVDALEAMHRTDVMEWIDSGAAIFRTEKPATPPKHLVAYCVLVDTETRRVLLVDHRDAQLWLPTGGHVDPGEPPSVAARREMREELGISPAFHPAIGDAPLMVTVTETGGMSASHVDVSLWFVFDGSDDPAVSPDAGEFVAAQWWDFDLVNDEPGTRFDPHLPRFIEKLVDATA